MNKKVIWIIVGLMSAALVGVVWLQMSLIFTTIKVNEDKFEKDVYDALKTVVQRLEDEEKREYLSYSLNGFFTTYYSEEVVTDELLAGIAQPFGLSLRTALSGSRQMLDDLIKEVENPCNCSECVARRDHAYRTLRRFYNQGTHGIPLEERVKLQHLQTLLAQEFANRGIDISYNFGVFSKGTNSFVILDGHYLVSDAQPTEILPAYKNIYNSRYRVNLFPQEMPSPGLLMVHFPGKNNYVWRSAWMNFLGTLLFSTIILLCFGYTINVIFRQKKLSEMKNDFINNMTHEFKTPIATISLAADSITSPIISSNQDKVQRFANIIKQENIRMNNQVEKVLQMAVIEKRDFSLKLTEVNLHEIIGHAIENISLQVEKRDGTARAVLEATRPIVEGDLTHIANIVNNLLDNANKYSPERPEITIYTRNVSGGVEVIVEDKGMGMSKEARKHIFDKFYRVHTGDLHDVKGFGLGLSYVKAMMTAHKGNIDVKSEPGKGSSFILFFPFQVS
ncbi:MAG TPA: HAMP domain-containing sensor histidine kinase [Saprospiraceae bacterium]|nr:HAMP domain-containing sensor histidine kinase [Saprospiraceae bacterium]HMP22673.1 HAMP domain-containing sensor histidine kinase [Saprospiraceae bacterium]